MNSYLMPSPSQIHQQCPCALVVAHGHNDHSRRNAAGRDWARAERSFDGNSVASRRLPFLTFPYAIPLSLPLALPFPSRLPCPTVAPSPPHSGCTATRLTAQRCAQSTWGRPRRSPTVSSRVQHFGQSGLSSTPPLLLLIIRCRFRRLTIRSRTVAATTSCSRSRTGCAARDPYAVQCSAVPVRFGRSRCK
jgi:hypothetical protein